MASASSRSAASPSTLRSTLTRNAPSRLAKAGTMTFCSTVSSGKISGVWNTRATPSWLIWCGFLPVST